MGDRETAPRFHVLREAAVATVEGDTDKERNDEDGEREMRKRERERERERERDATFEHVAKEKHRADNRLIGRIKLGNGKENKLGKQKKTALHRFCKRRTSLKRERERERERERDNKNGRNRRPLLRPADEENGENGDRKRNKRKKKPIIKFPKKRKKKGRRKSGRAP